MHILCSAIEMLRDLNQSSQRKSSFTDNALKKILEANLSAKYALNNYLGNFKDLYDTMIVNLQYLIC